MSEQTMSQSMSEEDFELVDRYSAEISEGDNLSCISAASADTDARSENADYESQAASDVTLRMPQFDRTEEFMGQATASMLLHQEQSRGFDHGKRLGGQRSVAKPKKGEQAGNYSKTDERDRDESDFGDNTDLDEDDEAEHDITDDHKCECLNCADRDSQRPRLKLLMDKPSNVSPFVLPADGMVILPLIYRGSRHGEIRTVEILTRAVRQLFGERLWHERMYSIDWDYDGSLCSQAKVSFMVARELKDMKALDNPFLIVEVLEDEAGLVRPDEQTSAYIDSLRARGVPSLTMRKNHNSEMQEADRPRIPVELVRMTTEGPNCECFTIDELDSHCCAVDVESAVKNLLELWQYNRKPALVRTMLRASTTLSASVVLATCVSLLLMMLATIAWSAYATNSTAQGMSGSGQPTSDLMRFHQITETNALIELPSRFRAQAASKVPEVSATVTRDGKEIRSRMQLVVDNLYALDWAQSEAHGELVVAAEMMDKKNPLLDAYVIHYSTKTPFFATISEKLRELNAEADVARRLQDLVKQVEESRSYVLTQSQHQLQYLKDHGSKGLQKIQTGYPEVLKPIGQYLHSKTPDIQRQGTKYLSNARDGLLRVRKSIADGPRVPAKFFKKSSTSRLSRWWHGNKSSAKQNVTKQQKNKQQKKKK